MEDRNILAADCIVLCCCCECMILQILVLLVLKLPHKLLRKTKEYAKRFRGTKKTKQTRIAEGSSFRIEMDDDFCLVESLQFGSCMSEIERALGDFSSRGEFGFGSFWGANVSSSRSFRSCLKDHDELDYEVVGCRLMELFGTADFSHR